MARPLSTDLRSRVIAHHKATGDGRILLSRLFSIGSATAYRWVTENAATGSVGPKVAARKGPLPKIGDDDLERLRLLVAAKRDRTLQQLCDAWREQADVLVDDATMHRALVRAGLSLKKRRFARTNASGQTS